MMETASYVAGLQNHPRIIECLNLLRALDDQYLKSIVNQECSTYCGGGWKNGSIFSRLVEWCSVDDAKRMVDLGASLIATHLSSSDLYPLWSAIASDNIEVAQFLLSISDLPGGHPNPNRPYPLLCGVKSLRMAEILLQHGEDPNGPPGAYDFQRPLYAMIASLKFEIALSLVKAGASVDFTCHEGHTILSFALYTATSKYYGSTSLRSTVMVLCELTKLMVQRGAMRSGRDQRDQGYRSPKTRETPTETPRTSFQVLEHFCWFSRETLARKQFASDLEVLDTLTSLTILILKEMSFRVGEQRAIGSAYRILAAIRSNPGDATFLPVFAKLWADIDAKAFECITSNLKDYAYRTQKIKMLEFLATFSGSLRLIPSGHEEEQHAKMLLSYTDDYDPTLFDILYLHFTVRECALATKNDFC